MERTNVWIPKRKRRAINWEIDIYTLLILHIKWITNEKLLYKK